MCWFIIPVNNALRQQRVPDTPGDAQGLSCHPCSEAKPSLCRICFRKCVYVCPFTAVGCQALRTFPPPEGM